MCTFFKPKENCIRCFKVESFSIIDKAIKSKKVNIVTHNLRDYADKSRHVDDSPYGGGAGMIIKIEPIDKCIEKLKEKEITLYVQNAQE